MNFVANTPLDQLVVQARAALRISREWNTGTSCVIQHGIGRFEVNGGRTAKTFTTIPSAVAHAIGIHRANVVARALSR